MRCSIPFPVRAMACLPIVLAIGCPSSSSRMVPAGGTVTYNGSPVEGAAVSFTPVAGGKGQSAMASTNSSGRFDLTTSNTGDGALPGKYNVTVIKRENPQDKLDADTSADERLRKSQDADGTGRRAAKSLIPEKYSDVKTSGLIHTVDVDGSEFKIDLKDG